MINFPHEFILLVIWSLSTFVENENAPSTLLLRETSLLEVVAVYCFQNVPGCSPDRVMAT